MLFSLVPLGVLGALVSLPSCANAACRIPHSISLSLDGYPISTAASLSASSSIAPNYGAPRKGSGSASASSSDMILPYSTGLSNSGSYINGSVGSLASNAATYVTNIVTISGSVVTTVVSYSSTSFPTNAAFDSAARYTGTNPASTGNGSTPSSESYSVDSSEGHATSSIATLAASESNGASYSQSGSHTEYQISTLTDSTGVSYSSSVIISSSYPTASTPDTRYSSISTESIDELSYSISASFSWDNSLASSSSISSESRTASNLAYASYSGSTSSPTSTSAAGSTKSASVNSSGSSSGTSTVSASNNSSDNLSAGSTESASVNSSGSSIASSTESTSINISGSTSASSTESASVNSSGDTSASSTVSASTNSNDNSSTSYSASSTSASATASATASACEGNTADTRDQWCDYSIDTDFYNVVPDTGVIREYWFELTEGTYAPDGVDRYGITINGSIPGPTITADWGDTVIVHLTNSLADSQNGTSLHFHGIRQNYTNDQDGVSSITQCPTAPGESIKYQWRATQYGTTWYHSHFALQAWQGVFGPIVINGPATSNYDEDLGTIFLNDWTHQTPDEIYATLTGPPPNQDNGLINGMNVWVNDNDTTSGERWSTSFTAGVSYRLRIISGAIDSHFKFSIDNHTLQVIASDLVPIEPYTTDILSIGGGQRYDVIVTADQADVASSFWMRAIPMAACSSNTQQDNIKGIIHYGDDDTVPTTTGYSYTDACDDETSNLVPWIVWTIGSASSETDEVATLGQYEGTTPFRWFLNSTTMVTDWGVPSLAQIYSNDTEFATSDAVIELPEANVWTYLVIETTITVAHPIHLHGHDFVILAQGSGSYDNTVTLQLDNPPRRDVAMLPASGYLAVAFNTDNPGAWLMHCHIGWHTSEGFALQFIERESEILSTVDTDRLTDTCTAWNNFQDTNSIEQEDSGI